MEGDRDEMEDEEDDDWMDTRWAEPDSYQSMISGGDDATFCKSGNKVKIQDASTSSTTVPGSTDPGAELMTRMQLNDNKAGMEGLDKEKINQIILEASKGSKYFENERKKEEQVKKRILEQQMKVEKITEAQLKQGFEEADRTLRELEETRDLSHTIIHIDMDAFYAAVEMRDEPSLRDKPMAVGGTDMLSTSNYLARKFGVRAAMPGFIGKKLCPELVIVKANFKQYQVVSQQVRHILGQYDPHFSPMSLDEAYLDMTEHLKKRQTMSESERSYVLRSCDKWDSTLCLCDLNEVFNQSSDISENQSQVNLGEHQTGIPIDPGKDSGSSYKGKDQFERPVNTMNQSESSMKTNDKSEASALTFEESQKRSERNHSDKRTGAVCSVCGKPFPPYVTEVFGTTPDEAVREMRSRIEQKTRLTASAGIAPNTMLAKVCSDRNKPNGQYRILPTRQAVMDFIQDLPIRKISGIGKVSETMLRALGVVKCPDLYRRRDLLYHLYSPVSFNHFMRICLAIGSTTVERDGDRKSMSTERTFGELSRPSDLYRKCSELCAALVEDLTEEELRGKTVGIKIKTVKFEVKTRAHSLPHHTADYEDIFKAARELLRVEILAVQPQPLRLRLMGVRLSNLLHASMCEEKKQDTITGLFRKMAARSPQKMQTTISRPDPCSDPLPLLPSLDLESTGRESCVEADIVGQQSASFKLNSTGQESCGEADLRGQGGQQTLASYRLNSLDRDSTGRESCVDADLVLDSMTGRPQALASYKLNSHVPDRTACSRATGNLTLINNQDGSGDVCDRNEETMNKSTDVPEVKRALSLTCKQKTVKKLFKPKTKVIKKEINTNTEHLITDDCQTTVSMTMVTASKVSSRERDIENSIENISTSKSALKRRSGSCAKTVKSEHSGTEIVKIYESAELAKTSKSEGIANTVIDYDDFRAALDCEGSEKRKIETPPGKAKKKTGRKKKNSTMVATPEVEESSGYESSIHSDEMKLSVVPTEPVSGKKGKKTKNQSTRTKKQRSSKLETLKEDTENCRSLSEELTKSEMTPKVMSSGDEEVPKKKQVPKEAEDVQNLKQFQCPVCHSWVESKNLNYFNDHVDVCLFKQISSQEQTENQPHYKETSLNIGTHETSIGKNTKNIASNSSDPKELPEQPNAQQRQRNPTTYPEEGNNSSSSMINQKGKSTKASTSASNSAEIVEHSNLTANVLIGHPLTEDKEVGLDRISSGFHSKTEAASSMTNHDVISSKVSDATKLNQDSGSSMAGTSSLFHESGKSEPVSRLEEEEEAEFYACPICNVEKLGCSLQEFNEHVDSCLSRRAIKQILQEQKNLPGSLHTGKRVASTSPSQPPAKRRKSDMGSKMKTIDSFFKT